MRQYELFTVASALSLFIGCPPRAIRRCGWKLVSLKTAELYRVESICRYMFVAGILLGDARGIVHFSLGIITYLPLCLGPRVCPSRNASEGGRTATELTYTRAVRNERKQA